VQARMKNFEELQRKYPPNEYDLRVLKECNREALWKRGIFIYLGSHHCWLMCISVIPITGLLISAASLRRGPEGSILFRPTATRRNIILSEDSLILLSLFYSYLPGVLFSLVAGFPLGRLSYTNACRQKLLAEEKGNLRHALQAAKDMNNSFIPGVV
jgi:hypothetical protein